ncbi:MAG: hypothetical protein ACI9CE_002767 [Flavobacterium sp.]|jgi:hypothetical protein
MGCAVTVRVLADFHYGSQINQRGAISVNRKIKT